MNEEEVSSLRKEVERVFKKSPPPTSIDITFHRECCADGKDLYDSFSGKQWWKIPGEIISDNHGNLPLFEDNAYFYYFPAFLLNALNDFSGHNIVLQFLVYDLGSFQKDDSVNSYSTRRSGLFSFDQKRVMVRFLDLVLKSEDEQMIYFHKDAMKALKFWE